MQATANTAVPDAALQNPYRLPGRNPFAHAYGWPDGFVSRTELAVHDGDHPATRKHSGMKHPTRTRRPDGSARSGGKIDATVSGPPRCVGRIEPAQDGRFAVDWPLPSALSPRRIGGIARTARPDVRQRGCL